MRSRDGGPLALGANGARHLADGRVEGDDPLARFSPNAAHHLLRTDGFPHVADIMVGSFYDPDLDEGCAFEELISFHGGLGGLDMLQGLVALIRDEYFIKTPNGALAVDVTEWGWIMLIWGAVLAFVGYGLLSGASWARWVAILGVGANFIAQLGFQGDNINLWGLLGLTLNVIILYALIVRWDESKEGMGYQ